MTILVNVGQTVDVEYVYDNQIMLTKSCSNWANYVDGQIVVRLVKIHVNVNQSRLYFG